MILLWQNSYGKFFWALINFWDKFLSSSINSHLMHMKFFGEKLHTGAQLLSSITFFDILHRNRVKSVGKKVVILLIFWDFTQIGLIAFLETTYVGPKPGQRIF